MQHHLQAAQQCPVLHEVVISGGLAVCLLLPGWPSFYAPVDKEHIIEVVDRSIPWMTACGGEQSCQPDLITTQGL